MREKNVKEIVRYYYEIPEMVRLLKTEQREQESLYDTLKGTGGDGMPGGFGGGADGVADRLDGPGADAVAFGVVDVVVAALAFWNGHGHSSFSR